MVGAEFTYHTEYVVDSGQGDSLCHPNDYVINTAATIHVIVTVKNLGEWVALLVKEFEKVGYVDSIIFQNRNCTDSINLRLTKLFL